MANTMRVYANLGSDFHPLANHMKTLRNFTKGEICELSAFPFSLLSDDFIKTTYKSCTNELACYSGYYIGLIFHKIR